MSKTKTKSTKKKLSVAEQEMLDHVTPTDKVGATTNKAGSKTGHEPRTKLGLGDLKASMEVAEALPKMMEIQEGETAKLSPELITDMKASIDVHNSEKDEVELHDAVAGLMSSPVTVGIVGATSGRMSTDIASELNVAQPILVKSDGALITEDYSQERPAIDQKLFMSEIHEGTGSVCIGIASNRNKEISESDKVLLDFDYSQENPVTIHAAPIVKQPEIGIEHIGGDRSYSRLMIAPESKIVQISGIANSEIAELYYTGSTKIVNDVNLVVLSHFYEYIKEHGWDRKIAEYNNQSVAPVQVSIRDKIIVVNVYGGKISKAEIEVMIEMCSTLKLSSSTYIILDIVEVRFNNETILVDRYFMELIGK